MLWNLSRDEHEQEQEALSSVSNEEMVSHTFSLSNHINRLRVSIDDLHGLIFTGLIVYGEGYRTGTAHGTRRIRAKRLAEEGRLHEAIDELQGLLAENKGT